MVYPAKQCDNDQSDYTDRHDEQHDPALLAVGARGQRNDADQAEQKRADEGRQHILRRAVFHDEDWWSHSGSSATFANSPSRRNSSFSFARHIPRMNIAI
jgi:hypothetical protein